MITEIKIEGFKSFGTPSQKLQLGPLNFVVGANASGKTNLIQSLRFLRYAVRENVEYAVNELGGIAEVRNKVLRKRIDLKLVTISLKIELKEQVRIAHSNRKSPITIAGFDYTLELDLRDESGLPVIHSEELRADIKGEKGQQVQYKLSRNKDEVAIIDETMDGKSDVRKLKVPPQETTRLALGVGFFSIPAVVLRDVILNWRFYNISPERARLPFKETPEVDLGPAGENLAVILHKIETLNGKGALDSVVAGLKGVVPGFLNIKTLQLPIEGKWAFQILEEKIKGTMNPDSISDGTIRLLALMVIAHWSAKNSSLIIIEEPENGLHPHLSEHIVNLLRAASEKRQFMITTHNPTFLDYVNPDEVILCDKMEGFTKLRKGADVAQIDSFRKHFRLGELWVQGTLGGIP